MQHDRTHAVRTRYFKPEIFIPLKHLTTTLELLGNILYVKNDFLAAKDCLERACPLMELLPASLVDNDLNDDLLQKAIAMSRTPIKHTDLYKGTQSPYAANCFSLLRDVYLKLYGTNGTFLSISLATDEGTDSDHNSEAQSTAATLLSAVNRMHLNTDLNTAATISAAADGRVKMSNFDHSYDDDDYLEGDTDSADYYTSGSASSFAVLEEQAHTSSLLASVPVSVTSKSKLLGLSATVAESASKLSSIRMLKPSGMSKLLLATHSLNIPDAAEVKSEILLTTKRDSKTGGKKSVEEDTFEVKLEAKFNELRSSFEHLLKDVDTNPNTAINTKINLFSNDPTAMDIDSEAIFELMSRSTIANMENVGDETVFSLLKAKDQTARVIPPPSTVSNAFDLSKPSISGADTTVPTARSKDESDAAIQEILFGDKPKEEQAKESILSAKKSNSTKTASSSTTTPSKKTTKSTKKKDDMSRIETVNMAPVERGTKRDKLRPQEAVDGMPVTDEAILNKLNDLKNQFFKQHADSFPDHPATLQAQLQERAKNQANFAASLLKSGDSKQHQPFTQTPFSKLEKAQRVPYSQVIATRLEHMVKEYVFAEPGLQRKAAVRSCSAFWEEFDMSFPDMDYSEYKSNMELGQTFLDVLTRLQEDGSDFVSQEVLEWQSSGLFTRTYSQGEFEGTGMHSFAINVEMFEDLSFGDRNHLLIVCAFDVAFNALSTQQTSRLQGQDKINYATGVSLYNLFEIATAAAANPLMNSAQQEAKMRLPSMHVGRKMKHSTVGSGGPAVSTTDSGTSATPKTTKKKEKKPVVSSTTPSTNTAQTASTTGSAAKDPKELATSYSRLDRDVTAALYEELLNGGNVDMSNLRSSMPMLNTDSEWTLRVIYLLLIITAGIIANLVYTEAQRKKTKNSRTRYGPSAQSPKAGGGGNTKSAAPSGVSTWIEDFVAMFDRNPPTGLGSASDEDGTAAGIASSGVESSSISSSSTASTVAADESPYLKALYNIVYAVYYALFSLTAFLVRYSVMLVCALYFVLNKMLTVLVDFYYSTQGASADVRHSLASSSTSSDNPVASPTSATATSKANKAKGVNANGAKGLSATRTAPAPIESHATDSPPGSGKAEANNLQGAVELIKILTTVASHLFTHIMNSVYAQFTSPSPSAVSSPVEKLADSNISSFSPAAESVKSVAPVVVAPPVSILSSNSGTDDKNSTKATSTKQSAGKKKMSVSFSQSDLASAAGTVVAEAAVVNPPITKAATVPQHTTANGKKTASKNGTKSTSSTDPVETVTPPAPTPLVVKAKPVLASVPVVAVVPVPNVVAPAPTPVVTAPSVVIKEKTPVVTKTPAPVLVQPVATPVVVPVVPPVAKSTGGLTVIKTAKPAAVVTSTTPVSSSVSVPVPLSQEWTHVTATSYTAPSTVRSKPLSVGLPVAPVPVTLAAPIVLTNKPVTISQLVDSALNTKRAVSVSLPSTPATTASNSFAFDESAFPAALPSRTAAAPVSTPVPVVPVVLVPAINSALPPPPPLRAHTSPESRGPASNYSTTVLPPSPVRVLASNGHAAPVGFVGSGVAPTPLSLNGMSSFGSFGFASNVNNSAPFIAPVASSQSVPSHHAPQTVRPVSTAAPTMMPPPGIQQANYARPPLAPLAVVPPPPQQTQFINWTSASPLGKKPPTYQPPPAVRSTANYFETVEEDDDESYSLLESANAFLEGLDYAPVMSPVTVRPSASAGLANTVERESFHRAESNYNNQSRRYEEQMSVEQHNNITLQALYSGLSPDAPSFRPGGFGGRAPFQQHQHFPQPQFNNMFSYGEDEEDSYFGAASHSQMQHQQQLQLQQQLHQQFPSYQSSSTTTTSSSAAHRTAEEEEDELYSRMLSDMDHVADLISDDEDE
eukprot:gene24509-30863_t